MRFPKPYPAGMTKLHDYVTFNEFWPYYLSEHAHPTFRLCHVVGTALALASAQYQHLEAQAPPAQARQDEQAQAQAPAQAQEAVPDHQAD